METEVTNFKKPTNTGLTRNDMQLHDTPIHAYTLYLT